MADDGSHIKATREDWIAAALDTLISDGVDQVKVLTLSEKLDVSRSSFYWYFKSRQQLLDTLLAHWQATNTAAMVAQAEAPAPTITAAVCNVWHCVIDPELFNIPLDFAVRDWARRSGAVSRVVDAGDAARLGALTGMFTRFGYETLEAEARARALYYMQIGYNDADLREPIEERLLRMPMYLKVFTGCDAPQDEVEAFRAYARSRAETL